MKMAELCPLKELLHLKINLRFCSMAAIKTIFFHAVPYSSKLPGMPYSHKTSYLSDEALIKLLEVLI